jgi:hypothetical protein
MLDSWQLERLFVYQILKSSYTWPASTISRTIGASGDFNATRPNRIDSAIIIDSDSQRYAIEVLQKRTEYDYIVIQSTESTLPQYIFMDSAFPLATLFLYPVPSVQLTLDLNTWQTLQSFSSLTTALSLPPGYERAIVYSLAEEYGPEFGVSIPADVKQKAVTAVSVIKNLNQPSMVAQVDYAVASLGKTVEGRYNIYSDEGTGRGSR